MRPPTNRELAQEAYRLRLPAVTRGGDLVVTLPGVASIRLAMGSGANRQVCHDVARRWRRYQETRREAA